MITKVPTKQLAIRAGQSAVAGAAAGAVIGGTVSHVAGGDAWHGATQGAIHGALGGFSRGFFLNRYAQACFTAGTPLVVDLEGNSKPIEEIQVGEMVLARNEFEPHGPLELKRVEELFTRTSPIIELEIGGRKIGTTDEHPFYVPAREAFVPARELQVGDLLISHDGQLLRIDAIHSTLQIATVYNLRVADYHTYFVGGNEWGFNVWIHNIACTPDQVTAATREVLSTATFRRNPGLRARVVEALRQNEFGQAQTLLQEVRGIGARRAEAIVQRLQKKAAAGPPVQAAPTDAHTLAHIFDGEVRTSPKKGTYVVGYHHEGDAANQAAQAARGTTVANRGPLDAHSVYEGTGVVIQGLPKASGRSTMFPDHWTQADVLRAVNEGWAARLPNVAKGPNAFVGRSTDGILMQYFLRRDGSGMIDSVYPLHGR